MDITISTHHLTLLIEQAAEMGAKHALTQTGRLKPYLKKSEAFRQFGRRNVEHWIEDALLIPRKDGDHSAALRLERIELEAISAAEDLLFYFHYK
ncbi:hypothetical protein SAMN05216464_12526 [Mucilaginibacter pineti]|uniref:Uncharacterized protein n=2 Tax=Mucilaginibacter pineti TaxID=1391627 RepID=A0A1G7N8G4_9SPHI|nr:hypothetical protein SAMN05216464_12526 [Mucilaginibacter pineti]